MAVIEPRGVDTTTGQITTITGADTLRALTISTSAGASLSISCLAPTGDATGGGLSLLAANGTDNGAGGQVTIA